MAILGFQITSRSPAVVTLSHAFCRVGLKIGPHHVAQAGHKTRTGDDYRVRLGLWGGGVLLDTPPHFINWVIILPLKQNIFW